MGRRMPPGKSIPLLLTAYADFCRMRLRRLLRPAGDIQESTRATTTSAAFIFPISFLLNAMPMFSGELTSQFLLLGSVMLIPRELNETVGLLLPHRLE
jgi:hypothetical protein